MTKIDFYVLNDASADTRLELACKLAEKASGRAQNVFIYSSDRQILQEFDKRLWNFRALSFVAHRILPADHIAGQDDNDPVLLSSDNPGNDRTLLMNMDTDVPAFFSRFERTLEIVNKEPDVQEAGRNRYRFYKQRGYPLQHHNL